MQFTDKEQFYDYMVTVCPRLDSFKEFSDLLYEKVVEPLQQHNEELIQRATKVSMELLSLKKREPSTYRSDVVLADDILKTLTLNRHYELIGIYPEKGKRRTLYRIIWRT